MKNYLLLFSALVLIFSSCSSSRYGHVPKSNRHNAKVVKHKSKYSKVAKADNNYTVLSPKQIAANTADNAEVKLNEVNPPVVATQKTTKKNSDRSTATKNTVQQSKSFVLSPPSIKKIVKESKQKAQEETQASRSWLYYIVVGIIFLLLAALIVWPFGWIFYIVGVIAIIIGLLALIGIV